MKNIIELLTQSDIQEFRILSDRASSEIFCNGGEKALFFSAVIYSENQLVEFSTNGKKVELQKL